MALDLPGGTVAFIDANILHYALIAVPPFSDLVLPFIDRLEDGDVPGWTSLQVLGDALHKTAMSLLAIQYDLPRANLVGWAKRHPEKMMSVSVLSEADERIVSLPLRIAPADMMTLRQSVKVTLELGLLTSDAGIVATMRREGLMHLVTNDDDFDRVSGITVWKPR